MFVFTIIVKIAWTEETGRPYRERNRENLPALEIDVRPKLPCPIIPCFRAHPGMKNLIKGFLKKILTMLISKTNNVFN